ncbi:VOC family protein [Halobellus sp. GM3]|uniref:VOC family protein n=1 Tax=Halobellus sp. GM3 TaxID=3458410 RepID=UPI00403DE6C9
MTELTGHHVGVTVSDLDRAIAFYRDTLGLDVLSRFSVGGEAFATGVGVEGARADFAHLDAGGVRLELVAYEPASETDAREAPPSLNERGATHVGLAVDDVRAWYAALPDDVETLSEPQTTESGTTICFVRDPEGNLVEVLSA